MPTRNVFLTEHFDSFIASGVETGRYSNASEVVREGLRLLEQHEAEDRARVEWLRGGVREGSDSMERGEAVGLTSDEEIDPFDNVVRARSKTAKRTGKIEDFFGLLAGKTTKVATLEELDEAAAAGWAGER